jgi:hypothetical protein
LYGYWFEFRACGVSDPEISATHQVLHYAKSDWIHVSHKPIVAYSIVEAYYFTYPCFSTFLLFPYGQGVWTGGQAYTFYKTGGFWQPGPVGIIDKGSKRQTLGLRSILPNFQIDINGDIDGCFGLR